MFSLRLAYFFSESGNFFLNPSLTNSFAEIVMEQLRDAGRRES